MSRVDNYEYEDIWGTDPRILHRRDAPWTSINAAYGVRTGKLEKMVFEAVCTYGEKGCIADDLLRDHPYLPYSSVTARPCALERKNLIVRGPDYRLGESKSPQLVMRKSAYADAILALPPPPHPPKRPRQPKS